MNKSTLVEKIAEIIASGSCRSLLDVRDESTDDVRIVLELKQDADAELVMAYLYKHTPLQTNFNVNLTCLVPTEQPARSARPQRLDLEGDAAALPRLPARGRHQAASSYELEQLKARLHILEGFEKVFDALDEMIRIIRKSEGKDDAAEKLMKRFKLDEMQADAILEMKLYKLARLEILVIQKELKEKRAEAKRLAELLKSDAKARWGVVRDELDARSAKTYGDKRRTSIGGAGRGGRVRRGGLHRRRGRARGRHPRRLGQARARDQGSDRRPACARATR